MTTTPPATRALQLALNEFNAGTQRAAREYATHPNAACYAHDCDELAQDNDVVCYRHRRERNAAARRMQQNRKAS